MTQGKRQRTTGDYVVELNPKTISWSPGISPGRINDGTVYPTVCPRARRDNLRPLAPASCGSQLVPWSLDSDMNAR